MADEKKSPNLKDRLKKTAVGTAAPGPVAPPAGAVAPIVGDALPPPPVAAPISGINDVAPPVVPGVPGIPAVPGIPGFGSDVAPPPFVQQQQAAAQAAARARAAAEDPFGAVMSAPVGPQEVRLVIDEKPVDDKEIGRKRTGNLIAIVATGVIALGGGYAFGGLMESKAQERQTLSAVNNVRTEFSRIGDLIATIRQKVDRAAERGNIQVQRGEEGEGQQQAATHPPEVDEELITWFREQPPEVPLSPDVYAGRVGRLRGTVVSKITLVQLQLNEIWQLLQRHARTDVTRVRAALAAANPQTNELSRMAVAFARNQQGAVFAQLVTVGQPVQPGGQVPISGVGIPAGQLRTLYQTGDIRNADLTTILIPVNPQVGVAAQAMAGAAQPWLQYRERVADMKQLADQLAQNHQQLMDALAGSSARGH
jgi:hypothetical protein